MDTRMSENFNTCKKRYTGMENADGENVDVDVDTVSRLLYLYTTGSCRAKARFMPPVEVGTERCGEFYNYTSISQILLLLGVFLILGLGVCLAGIVVGAIGIAFVIAFVTVVVVIVVNWFRSLLWCFASTQGL